MVFSFVIVILVRLKLSNTLSKLGFLPDTIFEYL
jgi:hypothetical protein